MTSVPRDCTQCSAVCYPYHKNAKNVFCSPDCRRVFKRAQKADYYKNNRDAIRKQQNSHARANSARYVANAKRWAEANPERVKQIKDEGSRRRRARLRGSNCEPYTVQDVLDEYGIDCWLCHTEIDLTAPRGSGQPGWEKGLHIDHVVPIARNGADTLSNVRPAHGLCNIRRGLSQLN